ncbi:MAG: FlgD immunoglobulin-like domain containing protein [Treponema sp.]
MKRSIFVLLCAFQAHVFLFAYNPPAGGESAYTFFSPDVLGGQISVTGGPLDSSVPAATAINPAVSSGEQRIILDCSYALLRGFGIEKGTKGHISTIGILYPARWGVITTNAHLFHSAFESLPWGAAASFRLAYAKELTDRFSLGIGAYSFFGTGTGLGFDFGGLYKLGNIFFLKDAKIGASFTTIGKPYNANLGGIRDKNDATGFPSLVTPRIGFAATFISAPKFKLGMHTDLSFPTFQNIVFDAGLHMKFFNMLTLKTGWSFNAAEVQHRSQSYIPSFGLAFAINMDGDNTTTRPWEQRDISLQFAAKPFYRDIWAFGTGIHARIGGKDTEPPSIRLEYPVTQSISPNNDGIQDVLDIPLSITDERYISAWTYTIKDEAGITVRTITNKKPFEQLKTTQSFWQMLTHVKQGVAVPSSLQWDGRLDSGGTAPDGLYYLTVTASDDSGNTATEGPYPIIVDTTFPELTVTPSLPAGTQNILFSPDGDGERDTLLLKQTTSPDAQLHAALLDSHGAVVRTFEAKEKQPADFEWDGKDDSGSFVPNGVYTYYAEATDKAGNSVSHEIPNIIVDAEPPSVRMLIDTAAYSPNGDGLKDNITFSPEISDKNGVQAWKVDIMDAQGTVVHTITKEHVAPIPFDGMTKNGTILPEGVYTAVGTAQYADGHQAVGKSPAFSIDMTKPKASVKQAPHTVAPDGNGGMGAVTLQQQLSEHDTWSGSIYPVDKDGKAVDTPIYTAPITKDNLNAFTWDGRTDGGQVAPDGKYVYQLTGIDSAGNTTKTEPQPVEVTTANAGIVLSANVLAFSPNGDRIQDSITFTPAINAAADVDSYRLTITDSAGTVVKTIQKNGVPPASISWDGTTEKEGRTVQCPDGVYSARMELMLKDGQVKQSLIPAITIDTVAPTIDLSSSYTAFSSDEQAARSSMPISQQSSKEKVWKGSIRSADGKELQSMSWEGNVKDFVWDGTDSIGNRVADGTYYYEVTAQDEAGNSVVQKTSPITIDSRKAKAYVTTALPAFSPNSNGTKNTQTIHIYTNKKEDLASWKLEIVPANAVDASPVKTWSDEKNGALMPTIQWDGSTEQGGVAAGSFVAKLVLEYTKGDTVTAVTAPFTSSVMAPELSVKIVPQYFSPDNDGNEDELRINLSALSDTKLKEWKLEIHEPEQNGNKLFWSASGKDKITEELVWDGRSLEGENVQSATDYNYTFTVTNELGMTSVVNGTIPIDVLLVRDGQQLKIAVPSIIFRKNYADFEDLDTAVIDKNMWIISRIAEILNKFPEYAIQVEGHANAVTGTEKEEQETLLPLSSARADLVCKLLIAKGVAQSRLTPIGLGSKRPVAAFSDRANWWKNRRVEFILIK